ncbi:class I SAM-dependent methyltransferase [Candidatus Omnitrophota bacterium]
MDLNYMQKKNDEIKFWDKVAQERIYAAFSEREYNEIFDANLNGIKNKDVLDIGCASGLSSIILSRRCFRVKGMDISPKLIEQANRLWKNEANQPEFFVGDAEKIPKDSELYDVCFLGGVIHHFPDYQRVINEILRVLKKGGILLMIEPNRLDIIERISWFFAGCLKLLSPNEYPVSPIKMIRKLEDNFTDFKVYPFRKDDIPFFSFIPLIGKFFKGGKGKSIKKIPLTLLNLFRPELHRGNFFVLSCIKK